MKKIMIICAAAALWLCYSSIPYTLLITLLI